MSPPRPFPCPLPLPCVLSHLAACVCAVLAYRVKGQGLQLLEDLLSETQTSIVLVCQSGNPKKDLPLPPPSHKHQRHPRHKIPPARGHTQAGGGGGGGGGGRGGEKRQVGGWNADEMEQDDQVVALSGDEMEELIGLGGEGGAASEERLPWNSDMQVREFERWWRCARRWRDAIRTDACTGSCAYTCACDTCMQVSCCGYTFACGFGLVWYTCASRFAIWVCLSSPCLASLVGLRLLSLVRIPPSFLFLSSVSFPLFSFSHPYTSLLVATLCAESIPMT
jgi:hypothetical protein